MSLLISTKNLEHHLANQKNDFSRSPFRGYQERIADLKALKSSILHNQQQLIEAMSNDFGHRSEDDSRIGDILTTVSGINYTIKRLRSWMKPKSKHIGLLFQPAKGKVLFQPKGVVGIIAPWNYPIFLSLGPLTAALAAGNNVMIKMSEDSQNTARVLSELMAAIYPKEKVAFTNTSLETAKHFSDLPFAHLFFTGSTNVGKLVLKAAANNLVPVTLELGGKSPAIIDPAIDIRAAVSRFIFGKVLNSGQTCVAPDYILCPRAKLDELIEQLKYYYTAMYPSIENNNDCTSIINQNQLIRLQNLIDDAKKKGAKIIPLLNTSMIAERKMPLTLIKETTNEMTVMKEEIFGPILPLVPYDSIEEAIDYVNSKPQPLSLYLYSYNKRIQQQVLSNTIAGGVCINEATFHVANDDLPFGGVGSSGMGQYHGDEGFKTFSHAKSVMSRGRISFAHLLFPPYGKALHRLVYKFFIR